MVVIGIVIMFGSQEDKRDQSNFFVNFDWFSIGSHCLAFRQHSTMGSNLTSHPTALGSILCIAKDFFLTEIYSLDVAEIQPQHCNA